MTEVNKYKGIKKEILKKTMGFTHKPVVHTDEMIKRSEKHTSAYLKSLVGGDKRKEQSTRLTAMAAMKFRKNAYHKDAYKELVKGT